MSGWPLPEQFLGVIPFHHLPVQSMPTISPGADGTKLPTGTLVFRIGKKTYLSTEALEKPRAPGDNVQALVR